MFFANFRYEILSKKLKERINDLHFLDREIFELNKNNKKVNLLVINYTILSFETFFEFKNKVSPKIRHYIEEALGEIPLMFFHIDNLKVDKKVKESISLLIDLADSETLTNHNKEELIREVFNNLKEIRYHFGKEKSSFELEYNQIFKLRVINQDLKYKIKEIKKIYEQTFKGKKIKKINEKIKEIFIEVGNLYFVYKENSLINLLENLSFFFYYKKKNLNQTLWNLIKEFIDTREYHNKNDFLRSKLNKLKELN